MGLAAGFFGVFLAPEIIAGGGTVAVAAGVYVGVNGIISAGANAINLTAIGVESMINSATGESEHNWQDLPDSVPAVAAAASGNSPDAQRAAAAVDLGLGIATGRFVPPGVLPAVAQGFGTGNDIISSADKTATAWGQTPGAPPVFPSAPPPLHPGPTEAGP